MWFLEQLALEQMDLEFLGRRRFDHFALILMLPLKKYVSLEVVADHEKGDRCLRNINFWKRFILSWVAWALQLYVQG